MMMRGEGFKKRIQDAIDARLQSLVREITIKTSGAGPGRGHKGKSHRKISLSLPEPLYLKGTGTGGLPELPRGFCPGTLPKASKRVRRRCRLGMAGFCGGSSGRESSPAGSMFQAEPAHHPRIPRLSCPREFLLLSLLLSGPAIRASWEISPAL